MLVSVAIVFPTALAASNPVKERELKIRTQLRVSGVHFIYYWGAFLLADYTIYFLMAVIYIISIYVFGITGLNNAGATGALVLLLIGWGVACLLMSYTASFLFQRKETVESLWSGIVLLASLFPYIIVASLDMADNRDTAKWLNVVFVILSPYYCGFSGVYYCFNVYLTSFFTTGKPPPNSAYLDWTEPMLPLSIIMVYVHIALYSVLLVIADVRGHGGQLPCAQHVGSEADLTREENNDCDMYEDDDVANEREKVSLIGNGQAQSNQEPVVLMEGLRKEFAKRTVKDFQSCKKMLGSDEEEESTKVAVRNLSMTVYPGEVVGLLGPNGAGKTTALNVLIADIGATKGRVSISGQVIKPSLSDAFKAMGYCPQSNPLWGSITLQEHLEIYATIRGVPTEKISAAIHNFMAALDILEHRDKRAKNLSGGTKRKLCFAISMLGNPQVVLLDEPSTGMDPKTKRFLWNTISTAFEGTNRGAILTTHYMEEADALCSRVGIMVLGQLRCLGSTQHLKGKFGQGYILEIKLEQGSDIGNGQEAQAENRTAELENFVKELFPSVEEPEKFGNRWTYKIKRDDVTSLAHIFSSLEGAKIKLGIEEYSFSQSTLEQVFLRFAKEQAVNDEEEKEKAVERKRQKKLRKRK